MRFFPPTILYMGVLQIFPAINGRQVSNAWKLLVFVDRSTLFHWCSWCPIRFSKFLWPAPFSSSLKMLQACCCSFIIIGCLKILVVLKMCEPKNNVLRRKMATCHLSKLGFPKWINMDGYSTRNDQNLPSGGSYNLTPSSKYDICNFHSFYNAYDGSIILLPSQYLLLMVWWPSSQYRGLSNPTFHHLTHITHAKKKTIYSISHDCQLNLQKYDLLGLNIGYGS